MSACYTWKGIKENPRKKEEGGGGKEKKKKSVYKIIKKSDGRFLPKGKSLEREKGSIPPPLTELIQGMSSFSSYPREKNPQLRI